MVLHLLKHEITCSKHLLCYTKSIYKKNCHFFQDSFVADLSFAVTNNVIIIHGELFDFNNKMRYVATLLTNAY